MELPTCSILFLLSCAFIASLTAAAPADEVYINRPRIVNGTDSSVQEIPFMASLEFFGSHTCGGAILTRDTVITAAHCLDYFSEHHPLSTLTIRVGTSYLQREGSVFNISRMIIHPLYNAATYDFDIALLKLATPITFGQTVQPVVLARNRADLLDDEMVQVSGWGRVRSGGPLADVLQKLEMPVLRQTECEQIFRTINTVTVRMFCAGYVNGAGDSCNGDSGGPLVNRNNVLYGLVSWGPSQCALQGFTGVYTSVAHFQAWIQSQN